MTKQIPDKVLFKNQEYILAGLKGNGLLTPIDFGITATMMTTGCYRGYFCQYTCLDDKLFLTELTVRPHNHKIPIIDGISANLETFALAPQYQNLKILCPLSGGLVIVRNPFLHVGTFPRPLEFSEVIEIIFEQGILQSEIDHSVKMANLRQLADELRKTHWPTVELLGLIRKSRASPEKLSTIEWEKVQDYLKGIQDIHDVVWSFVSNYKQQPTIKN